MGNKELNKDEEYLYSLPDYVNGKLPDGSLKSGIENRINSDDKFRAEYESMKNTMMFVRDSALENPPEHYFNSLVPRINERLESVPKPAVHPVFHLWRYIVPALTVVLVMIIILRPGKENIENLVSDSESITEKTEIVSDTLTGPQETVNVSEEQESTETAVQNVKQKTNKQVKANSNEGESFIESVGELFEESNSEESEYYNFESDFRTLTPSEQSELLKNLETTKF